MTDRPNHQIGTRTASALVFVAAAAVLVIEILAGRLMAPYVGVTLKAFTGIIGTVLAAIAVGSWVGGRAADRGHPVRLIGLWFVGGGVLAMTAPTLVTLVGPSLRGSHPLQIVVLATLGFFMPALALSAVAPAVVATQLENLTETGTVVGRFSAIGTAGALVGTFVTGFVLVAAVPTRLALVGVGIALVAVGAMALSRSGGRSGVAVLTAALVASASLAIRGPCDIETTYSCAFVQVDPQRPTGRILWLDSARHSYSDADDPFYLGFRYMRLFAAVVDARQGAPARVLSVGGGGFTFPRWLRAEFPRIHQIVLELDPRLETLARTDLGLTPADIDQVVVGDARTSIHTIDGPFDLVVADAFGGFVVPWHLTTTQFFTDVADRMSIDGALLMNLIDHPPSHFARAEAATLAGVFDNVIVIAPVEYFSGSQGGNYVLVGSHAPLDAQAIASQIAERGGSEVVIDGETLITWIGEAGALVDDHAPVDQLITR